ncbi:bacteriohemerythrin [Nitrosophilus alvini]|uniref:bacteriohemerythrin n=1 Tax=Nitrosophilus alvini TaxID=2714855 RepID=UPI00190E59DE|nr:hemerythrin family protein [Nitrosophilus alvini]
MKNVLYIIWNDENDLGIPIIDEQHKGIVSIINSLYFFMQNGDGEDELLHIIDLLDKYIKVHFKTEEALIKKALFPGCEKHLLMHKEFFKKMQKIRAEALTTNEPKNLLSFLRSWWLEHIKKEDIKYVPFVMNTLEK